MAIDTPVGGRRAGQHEDMSAVTGHGQKLNLLQCFKKKAQAVYVLVQVLTAVCMPSRLARLGDTFVQAPVLGIPVD